MSALCQRHEVAVLVTAVWKGRVVWPQMLAWAFEPAEEEVLVELISKGRADAEAWALRSGAAAALEEVETAAAGLQNEDYPALKN